MQNVLEMFMFYQTEVFRHLQGFPGWLYDKIQIKV